MQTESKQPHTSSLRGKQILKRRKEIERELVEMLKPVTDAWNYFPHKVLGGISPAEMTLKHQQKHH